MGEGALSARRLAESRRRARQAPAPVPRTVNGTGLNGTGHRAEAKGAGLVTSFRNAHAPQVMIHGSKPISATIGNYNAVYRVLKGTPHEWMLERHLEPK